MKINYTKQNIKDIGKDAKDLGKATAHLIKDTLKLPVSFGKDVNVARKERIAYKELLKLVESGKATVQKIDEVEAEVKKNATQPA